MLRSASQCWCARNIFTRRSGGVFCKLVLIRGCQAFSKQAYYANIILAYYAPPRVGGAAAGPTVVRGLLAGAGHHRAAAHGLAGGDGGNQQRLVAVARADAGAAAVAQGRHRPRCDAAGGVPAIGLYLWADRLSRTRDSTDWALARPAFERLEGLYGPQTVDLFAMAENAQCGRFYSKLPAPGGAGVDAMRISSRSDNAWANPPFNLLGLVVDKIVREDAAVTLVAPFWPAQPWWPLAVRACTAFLPLPAEEGVFLHGSRTTPVSRPDWRVVVFRFGTACAATVRWDRLVDGLRARRFGWGEGAVTARRLVSAKYQSSTKKNYVNAWERIDAFCQRVNARAMPASPETVVRYMASLYDGGTCAPDTVGSYLAAIWAVHRVAGLPSPTDDPLVADARVGYRRLHTDAAGGLPEVRGPLPPEAVTEPTAIGMATSDAARRRECAGLVLAFLMFNRPWAADNMRARDLRLSPAGFQVQVPVYKMGVLKRGARLAFTIPVAAGGWGEDAPLSMVRRVCT